MKAKLIPKANFICFSSNYLLDLAWGCDRQFHTWHIPTVTWPEGTTLSFQKHVFQKKKRRKNALNTFIPSAFNTFWEVSWCEPIHCECTHLTRLWLFSHFFSILFLPDCTNHYSSFGAIPTTGIYIHSEINFLLIFNTPLNVKSTVWNKMERKFNSAVKFYSL